MTTKEPEPKRLLDVPVISPKTLNKDLKEWSSKAIGWPSDGRRRVAQDVVNNGKELVLGSNVDWNLVLPRISALQWDTVLSGEAAIAANGARFIGGLAAHAGWSMHDPQSVYLSGKYLAHIAGSKLEDFKTTMTKRAVFYGEKTLPEAELLMKTLDLLLEHADGKNRSNLARKVGIFLHDGKIQDAYSTISSREDRVRSRA